MYLPQLSVPQTSRMMTEVFYGYNHNLRIQQGESWDQVNITCDSYPVLSQRKRRRTIRTITSPQGLTVKESLVWVAGEHLIINGSQRTTTEFKLSTDPAKCPKQLVSMGAYLIVFPDGMYFNTSTGSSEQGYIDASFSHAASSSAKVTYNLCAAIGTPLNMSNVSVSATPPDDPQNGDYWIDTSVAPQQLKQWTSYSEQWTQVPSTYVQIGAAGIDDLFEVGDGITLSGIAYDDNDTNALSEALAALNGDNIIVGKGEDWISITGMLPQAYAQETGTVKAERKAPAMDYVIESNNRLWGCKFGLVNGEAVNEIYACKLGDFKNWRVYAGVATDSYAVSVGSDGPFTGAITYNNYPFFFKEDCVHQVYGAYPATYQVTHQRIPGVQRGSAASLVNEGGYLFYKSPVGVCQYDGSTARYISDPLGGVNYLSAVAGTFRDKVYFCLKKSSTEYELMVYDLMKGFWAKEDGVNAKFFAASEYDLFFIDADGHLMSVNGTDGGFATGTTEEGPVYWEAVSGQIGYEYPDQKYLSRFNIRMSLGAGSTARLYIQYDSDGEWRPQGAEMRAANVRTFTLPVIPRRCDHMQWKLCGRGEAKLYSIAKIYEAGSDVT